MRFESLSDSETLGDGPRINWLTMRFDNIFFDTNKGAERSSGTSDGCLGSIKGVIVS